MSAAAQTKIFGVRVKVDPKILVGILIALAVILFWYNSRGDDEPSGSSTGAGARPAATIAPVPAPARTRLSAIRRTATPKDSGTLRLRAVDATSGDVDPTLRLDLLQRLASVQLGGSTRSLFEAGPAVQAPSNLAPIKGPIIPVGPRGPSGPTIATPPAAPVVNIPLKYYGFAKPLGKGESNRGFFMDGENVLVASEGDLIQQQYLVVELTPSTARMEDVHLKQGQTLQVVPEATAQ